MSETTTPLDLELARAGRDLPGFRWMPGMLDTDGWRVVTTGGLYGVWSLVSDDGNACTEGSTP